MLQARFETLKRPFRLSLQDVDEPELRVDPHHLDDAIRRCVTSRRKALLEDVARLGEPAVEQQDASERQRAPCDLDHVAPLTFERRGLLRVAADILVVVLE